MGANTKLSPSYMSVMCVGQISIKINIVRLFLSMYVSVCAQFYLEYGGNIFFALMLDSLVLYQSCCERPLAETRLKSTLYSCYFSSDVVLL